MNRHNVPMQPALMTSAVPNQCSLGVGRVLRRGLIQSALFLVGILAFGLLAGPAWALEVENQLVSVGLPSDTGNGASHSGSLSSSDGRFVVFSSQASNLKDGIVDFNDANDVYLFDRTTLVRSLVSRSSVSLTTTANGQSTPVAISDDGEWVLFQSLATDLVSAVTDDNAAQDVFLYQRSNGAVSLVSRAAGSATTTANGGDSIATAISADGEWVLFQSNATDLVNGVTDINHRKDAFLYQRSTGLVSLVSRSAASAMTTANGESMPTDISADGEWLLFSSDASDLVSGVTDSNGTFDVFLRQRSTGAVSLVSRSAVQATSTPAARSFPTAISADGEWVLFQSEASNLVSGVIDTNFGWDAFVYRRSTGAIILVSRSAASASMAANAVSVPTAISKDGEWIVFVSLATNLVSGVADTNINLDAFIYQNSAGEVTLLSRSAASASMAANGFSFPVAISDDGEWTLLQSGATNLVSGISDTNSDDDVFLYKRSSGTLSLVSGAAGSAMTANGRSFPSAISADGDWVLFESTATNLFSGTDSNLGTDMFIYQRSQGTTDLVSRAGVSVSAANGESVASMVSADGEWVLFNSRATDLASGVTDTNQRDDVFLYQRSTGWVSLVSRSSTSATTAANSDSFPAAISADGEWVLFSSLATDLVSGVTDIGSSTFDVFLFQRSTGGVRLVSRSAFAATTANAESFPTALSANGEWILFASGATDLVPGVTDNNDNSDVFLYQRGTGVVSLVSRAAASMTATANSYSTPTALSADADWVLFGSAANDLVAGITDGFASDDVFLYQRSTGVVSLVSRSSESGTMTANDFSVPTAVSADGGWVLFRSSATDIVPGVTDTNGQQDAFLYQRSAGTASLVSRSAASTNRTANLSSTPTAISADGEFVLFQSFASDLVSGAIDNNGSFDVFVYQRSTGAVTLVSSSAGSATTTANAESVATGISANGESVLFRSAATNLVPGVIDNNAGNDVFLYQLNTGRVSLVSRSAVSATTTANRFSEPTAISADGASVLFQSFASNLVGGVGDTNQAFDVFLGQVTDGLFVDGFESP